MAPRRLAVAIVAGGVLAAAGCKGDIATPMNMFVVPDISRPECENLNPLECLMPWPSSRYEVEDASTRTGRRIALPMEAMPANMAGTVVTPDPYNRLDGWSPMTSLVTAVNGELDASVLPDELHIEASLSPGSPTVLLDADTGERIPHFAEIDGWPDTNRSRPPLYIRPAVRLPEGHRFIAAIRSLTTKTGQPIPPSSYFQALRDSISTPIDELEARRDAYEDIFARLEAAGVARASLIEAWDFHTASDETGWEDLVAARDDAVRRLGPSGIGCTVTNVDEPPSPNTTYRHVSGTFTAPSYMDNSEPGGRLVRDASGRPAFQSMIEVPFELVIPTSVHDQVAAGGGPAPLVIGGHGLFQSARMVVNGFSRVADTHGVVVVGTDWWGLSDADLVHVATTVGDMGRFPEVSDRMLQGVINTIALTRSFMGVCAALPETQIDLSRRLVPTFDPSRRSYAGWSLGAIMGITLAAVSPDLERFALVAGGVSFPIMVPRSVEFPDFNSVMTTYYPEKLDRALLVVMSASLFDTAEPSSFARHVLDGSLAGDVPRQVLLQIGRYDALVPNAASGIAARTIGLQHLSTPAFDVWAVPEGGTALDSALVTYDLRVAPTPVGTVAPDADNGVHSSIQALDPAIRQIGTFLREGRIESYCTGRCDPQ